MSRSLKHRVAKLEEQVGRKPSEALILVEEGKTKRRALRRHFREHPEHQNAEFLIFSGLSPGETRGEGQKKPPGRIAQTGHSPTPAEFWWTRSQGNTGK